MLFTIDDPFDRQEEPQYHNLAEEVAAFIKNRSDYTEVKGIQESTSFSGQYVDTDLPLAGNVLRPLMDLRGVYVSRFDDNVTEDHDGYRTWFRRMNND